jgi:hypothetical protein
VRGAALSLAAALALVLPATAGAHSIVRTPSGEITYTSADATSLNTLTGIVTGDRIELRDPTVDGGIDPGPCDPLEVSDDANSWIVRVACRSAQIGRVRIDLGEREDRATVDVGIPVTLHGGPGADGLQAGATGDEVTGDQGNDRVAAGPGDDLADGGDGDDVVEGDPGNDIVDGGLGFDALTGGDGDDDLRSADGLVDQVDCGGGADRVDADTFDEIQPTCESVLRRLVAPPPGYESTAGDVTPPEVRAGGSTLQRMRKGRVRMLATSSERGVLAASGFLDTAGIALPLQSDRIDVPVAGGGVKLTIQLSRRERRLASKSLRRGRKATVRMWAVGTDAAGNSARAKSLRIRLRK